MEEYKEFSDENFTKLMKELMSIDYSNCIAIGRYHEPLMYPLQTIKRCKAIKAFIPNSRLLINTNGDYVTKELLRELSEAGVDEIKIMRYQNDYSDITAKKICLDMIHRLDMEIVSESLEPMTICKYRLKPVGQMHITIKSENYNNPARGCNRGGLIQSLSSYCRTEYCDVPVKNIDIDYNGNIMPCNNLLSDASEHKKYILGNISDVSIFKAYMTCLESFFLKRILTADFSKDPPCQHCSYFYKTDRSKNSFILK